MDGSKEINIVWGIQVPIFHNGPWVSTNHPVARFPRITSLASEGIVVPSTSTIWGVGVWRASCGDCRADSTSSVAQDRGPGLTVGHQALGSLVWVGESWGQTWGEYLGRARWLGWLDLRQSWALGISEEVVKKRHLLFHFLNFLCMLVEDMFAHKLRTLEFLATERTQPLILAQFLRVGGDELLHFLLWVFAPHLLGLFL